MKPKNYDFLHRFLDATKANLFFARGVILVEGDAENLLLPTIAEIIDRPLHRYGVSVVNVGSTAFLHYAKIFARKDAQTMGIPVAVVTDMDVKPEEWEDKDGNSLTAQDIIKARAEKQKWASDNFDDGKTKAFVASYWTLEYDIALEQAFARPFYESVLWAEKLSNAKSGKPQEHKAAEVRLKAKQDIARWLADLGDDPRKQEKVAFEIYKKTMLDKDISKAITAQVCVRKLVEYRWRDKLSEAILKSAHLKYLVDAIYHVTKPRDTEEDDASDH